MSNEMPGDLQYTKEHEWLRREDDGSVTIGITDHAQSALATWSMSSYPKSIRSSNSTARWPLSNR